ncbi:MAG: polysaccharide biosynthesis protein [Verrucomicrobia bacterium]|nr:polysaccharide biosynthesis protein [Verrucomicrobiota bacterium]
MKVAKPLLLSSQSSWGRNLKRTVFFAVLLYIALWIAYEAEFFLRADCRWIFPGLPEGVPGNIRSRIPVVGLVVVPLQLIALYLAGTFRSVFCYFRIPEMSRVFVALTLCFILMFFGMRIILTETGIINSGIHSSVLVIDYFLSIIAVCGVRVIARMRWEQKKSPGDEPAESSPTQVVIFGAGDAGANLATVLKARPGFGKKAMFFLDDNPEKSGMRVVGLPVFKMSDDISVLRDRYNVTQMILAVPSGSVKRSREVTEIAKKAGLSVMRVPGMEDLISGRTTVSDLREVALEDLLERPATTLDRDAIAQMLSGKRVLVTGAGGSIGSEICRQVAACGPAQLLLVEQCEVLLYQIEQDLIRKGFGGVIKPLIADITDRPRMEQIFGKFHPEYVFHAAAHKHVPMMESQPAEAVKNNALGTASLVELASDYGAEAFVLISTDKAINPTNAMGASKRLAEIILQANSRRPGNRTRFMAVRFGNVLGSSGSVIPVFRRQIAEGGPITVTHPDIKRYFMTIPEAVGLVLQTAVIGKGGSIYVLNMGEPVKIIDVARHLVRLSGLRPDVDIEIKISGLRPGEKLFEELKTEGEEFEPSGHSRISRFISTPMDYDKLEDLLAALRKIVQKQSRNEIKQDIRLIIPEYVPYLD